MHKQSKNWPGVQYPLKSLAAMSVKVNNFSFKIMTAETFPSQDKLYCKKSKFELLQACACIENKLYRKWFMPHADFLGRKMYVRRFLDPTLPPLLARGWVYISVYLLRPAYASLGSSHSTSTKLLVVEYLDTGSYRKATTYGDRSIWAFFASALKLAYSDSTGRAYIIIREMQLQCDVKLSCFAQQYFLPRARYTDVVCGALPFKHLIAHVALVLISRAIKYWLP